ncbi:response regulator transcription factor [Peribacillus alkalitolerans]|uniref:response regulator transcription factor n=1 Tax=Peribacillus alkalitolerans TaxID=1550385 RepID=UPI0013D81347|nr:response regulator transcription factor [Peribacillus alkalitolerans]
MKLPIFIIEDDIKLAELLTKKLNQNDFETEVFNGTENILGAIEVKKPALILLDIELPKFDGFYWCRQIRTITTCPIIFITARAGDMEQILALEQGADDYVTKPFHTDVLMAKIRSHLRRSLGEYASLASERKIEFQGINLFPERLEVSFNGRTTLLTYKESRLLECLLKKAPHIVSRDSLFEALWDDEGWVDENTLNVNVNRVRKKLASELMLDDCIETIRGAGYRLYKKESAPS